MTPKIASAIAYMLNEIGVVTHDDIGIGDDNDFGRWVCNHETLLRKHGYIGGELKQWNTAFRTDYWVYGAIDTNLGLADDRLDAYFTAISGQITDENLLEESKILLKDVPKFKLFLVFHCQCKAETIVNPSCYPIAAKGNFAYLASAQCSTCKTLIKTPTQVQSTLCMPTIY